MSQECEKKGKPHCSRYNMDKQRCPYFGKVAVPEARNCSWWLPMKNIEAYRERYSIPIGHAGNYQANREYIPRGILQQLEGKEEV